MEETAKISKKLERLLQSEENPEQIIKYMERMSEVEMTLNILTKTGIGLIINKFRKKCTNASVTVVAKRLIKQWKKLVPKDPKAQKRSRQSLSEEPSPSRDSENGSSDDDKPSYSDKRLRQDASDSSNDTKTFQPAVAYKQVASVNQNTTDPYRLKARDMIFRALSSGDSPPGAFSADYLAMSIETAIFNVFLNNGAGYKQRVRTRVMNLKDKNNEELRLNVLVGSISAEKLAVMSSEDMASKDMKELRSKFLSEVIHEAQLTECVTASDGVVQCRRCKKYKVSYNQAQTRSADEPMTTFAFCHTCGHRWKFC